MKIAVFSILFIFLFACGKDIITVEPHVFLEHNSADWNAFQWMSDGRLMVCGGTDWVGSYMAIIGSEESKLYKNDTLGELNCIGEWGGRYYAGGLNGVIATYKEGEGDATFHQSNFWNNINALTHTDGTQFLVVGSSVRQNLMKFEIVMDQWWKMSSIVEFPDVRNANDIVQLRNDSLLICGFGYVAFSVDVGKSWSFLSVEDGNYVDIEKRNNIVYILSQKGNIYSLEIPTLKLKLHKSASRFQSIRDYKAIWVSEDNTIFCGAEEGKIIFSQDKKNWKQIQLPSEYQINWITGNAQEIYVGGEFGLLMKFHRRML